MKKVAVLVPLIFSTVSNAVIIESNDIRSVLHHVYDTHHHREILVAFDIDNTLGHMPDGFGGDELFNAMVNERLQAGDSFDDAITKLLPLYVALQEALWLEPIQETTARMIRFMQEIGIATIALTARLIVKDRTLIQLDHMDIDFEPGSPHATPFTFAPISSHHQPGHYERGVIFCGNNNKGAMLTEFFAHTNYRPKKVIFVDDKLSHVRHVEAAMEQLGIPCIGIRYSHLDEKVANFRFHEHHERLRSFKTQLS